MSRGSRAPERPSRPPDRASRFRTGLKSIPQALWFLISLVIYALGLLLVTIGRAVVRLSGRGTARGSATRIDTDRASGTPHPNRE